MAILFREVNVPKRTQPIKLELRRLTRIASIRGVGVYVHWSVFVVAAVILLGALRRPVVTIVGLFSYLSVLLIHECGHLIAAQRKGYAVFAIELSPIHGITRFHAPWSRLDHSIIAWGGVEAVNAVLALLGFFSLGIAALNLIPKAPLDGAIAWGLIPELVGRARARRSKFRPKSRF